MKKIICLVVVLISYRVCAKNYEEIFLQANSLYSEGKFEDALSLYESIQEPKGWATWYNMGACCYHLQTYIQALVYWERAAYQGGATDPLVQQGLYDVNKQLDVLPQYSSLWYALINFLSLRLWQILVLCCIFLSWFLFIISKHKPYVMILVGMVCLLSGAGLLSKVLLDNQQYGIIQNQTDIFIGKNNNFASIATAKPGEKVLIQKCDEAWIKIKIGSKQGWIPSYSIIII